MKNRCPVLANFFKTALHYYLIPDLERLRNDVRPKEGKEGCTIATASLAFSLIDLIGFLMRPGPREMRWETIKNFDVALSLSNGLFPSGYAAASPVLVKLFRHGITHQVFPKSCGISKPNKQCPLLFSIDGSTPNLNVDVLVDDLLSALNTLERNANADPTLAAHMESGLVWLQQKDDQILQQLKCDGTIGNVFKKLQPVTTTTTTTTPR